MPPSRLDPEKTAPFELGPPGPPVLLVHGFTGSPWDVRPLGEALARRGFRVRALRLPGHGSTPQALLRAGRRHWQLAVEDALLALSARGARVHLAGLSMGALLCVRAAALHEERVASLALLAPALRLAGPRLGLARALSRAGLLTRLYPWVPKGDTDLQDEAERASAPVLASFPSARLEDLFALQEEAAAALPRVRCPALVVTAREDHVLAPECGPRTAAALTGATRVRHIRLQAGFHILPRDRDRALLAQEVGDFFARQEGNGQAA